MGFSISCYAVPEKNADGFVTKLQLAPTGETEEISESLNAMGKLNYSSSGRAIRMSICSPGIGQSKA